MCAAVVELPTILSDADVKELGLERAPVWAEHAGGDAMIERIEGDEEESDDGDH